MTIPGRQSASKLTICQKNTPGIDELLRHAAATLLEDTERTGQSGVTACLAGAEHVAARVESETHKLDVMLGVSVCPRVRLDAMRSLLLKRLLHRILPY
jgi:hypothetical protein